MPPMSSRLSPPRHAYATPDLTEFTALAADGATVPIYRTVLADHLTPVSAFQRIAQDSAHAFLLESVVGGDRIARYSFVGANPRAMIKAYANRVVIERFDPVGKVIHRDERHADDPLKELEKLLKDRRQEKLESLPAFTGGAVGYAGYDTVRYLEPEKLAQAPRDVRRLPDLLFGLYDDLVLFDHVRKTVLLVTHAQLDGATAAQAHAAALQRLDRLMETLSQKGPPGEALNPVDLNTPAAPDYVSNFTRENYEHAVLKARQYIQAGDIFQVVLSQCLTVRTAAAPLDIYRALRVINPSPFMFFLKSPECILVGSSPEIMCRVQDGVITNRPLAGTRRRGETRQQDEALEKELLADPKERSEHIMLVDLGRNDVGRAAVPGTVQLGDIMSVERYSHVMHIVSNVTGRLAPDKTVFDALRLALPVGTVSGAPKVRAMQIIDELEPTKRGPYAGAVGYIDYIGNMDTCIVLRTMVVVPDAPTATGAAPPSGNAGAGLVPKYTVYVQSGGGIVADSTPALEFQECLNKAAGPLKAIALAERDLT